MNAATRPPLYAYQEAFKKEVTSRVTRVNRFSDTDYNYIVTHISAVNPATDDHYFNIKTGYPREVRKLLKDTGIISAPVMTVNLASGTILVQYSLNKAGKKLRNEEMEKLQRMVAGGPIVRYEGDNPLYGARNLNGDIIAGLTEVNNQSETVAEVDPNGNVTFVSKEYGNQILNNLEEEKNVQSQTKTTNYILGAVALIAIIVMIWVVKKNK